MYLSNSLQKLLFALLCLHFFLNFGSDVLADFIQLIDSFNLCLDFLDRLVCQLLANSLVLLKETSSELQTAGLACFGCLDMSLELSFVMEHSLAEGAVLDKAVESLHGFSADILASLDGYFLQNITHL